MAGMNEASAPPQDDGQNARELFSALIQQGRFAESAELFDSFGPALPLDPQLKVLEAFVRFRVGQNELAAQCGADAVALGASDPLALLVRGAALRNLGRNDEAANALLAAHRAMPSHLEAATMLVETAAAAHGIDAARAIYDEVAGRLPHRAVAAAWGRVLLSAGRTGELPASLRAATITSVPAWLAARGEAPEWVGEREMIPIQTPALFGSGAQPGPLTHVPGYVSYAASLRDATIFGKSSVVLTADGALLNDTMADERFGRFLLFPHDPRVVARRGDEVVFDAAAEDTLTMDVAVMLSGWSSEHFGHWVPEYLCRLSYLEKHPRFAGAPIVVDSGMPPQHLEYLRLLVSNPIVELAAGQALRCGELLVGSPSTFFPTHVAADHTIPQESMGGLSLPGFRHLQQRVQERLPPLSAGGRKLFLSRRTRSWRRLVNEDEVGEMLEAMGFETVFAEDISLEAQVRMYQSAEIVVAPNGSALLNAIFAPRGAKIIVLGQRELFNANTYYGFMRELGYDPIYVSGEGQRPEKHADFSVPLTQLAEAIAV